MWINPWVEVLASPRDCLIQNIVKVFFLETLDNFPSWVWKKHASSSHASSEIYIGWLKRNKINKTDKATAGHDCLLPLEKLSKHKSTNSSVLEGLQLQEVNHHLTSKLELRSQHTGVSVMGKLVGLLSNERNRRLVLLSGLLQKHLPWMQCVLAGVLVNQLSGFPN